MAAETPAQRVAKPCPHCGRRVVLVVNAELRELLLTDPDWAALRAAVDLETVSEVDRGEPAGEYRYVPAEVPA